MKRFELKYYLTTAEANLLCCRLEKFLDEDKYTPDGKDTYLIRSLYFDNLGHSSLWEKLGGFQNREKFRLRIYNTPWRYGDIIKFEIKRKHDDLVEKKWFKVTRDEAEQLIRGSCKVFNNNIRQSTLCSYIHFTSGYYKPSVIIEYYRKAFHARINNLRITVDYNLTKSNHVNSFWHNCKGFKQSKIIQKKFCILEIKYNYYFPSQYSFLFKGVNSMRSAISKYAMGLNNCDLCELTPRGGELSLII